MSADPSKEALPIFLAVASLVAVAELPVQAFAELATVAVAALPVHFEAVAAFPVIEIPHVPVAPEPPLVTV